MIAFGADEGVHGRDIRPCCVVFTQLQEALRITFDKAAAPTPVSEICAIRKVTPIPRSELNEIAVTDIRKVEQVIDNTVLAALRKDISTPPMKRQIPLRVHDFRYHDPDSSHFLSGGVVAAR